VPEHLDALDRLGPTVHHRSFFAPVVAARAKHMPWTVEPALPDLFSVTEVETSVEIEASAGL
jgi:ribonuclease HII